MGAGTAWTLAPNLIRGAEAHPTDAVQVLFPSGRSLGYFPNVTGPRLVADDEDAPAVLIHSVSDTVLHRSGRKLSLGSLARARMVTDSDGVIHVAGLRDDGLWLVRVTKSGKPTATQLATFPEPHPAAGLDVAWTAEGLRIIGPGPTPRTMAVYTDKPEAKPLVLTIHAPVHPLLRYDAGRHRLHAVFCPWNDYSAIYDTVYYLRSDDHGASWLKSDGSKHELPLQPTAREHGFERPRPEPISITGQPAGGHSNTLAHCLDLDADGHPHLLYTFNRPYHLAREPFMRCVHICWDGAKWSLDNWDGSKWKSGELSADFSMDVAGGCLDIVDRKTIRALLMFKDRKSLWLDLGIASSNDGGKTWSAIKPITTDSGPKAAHYVAPSWVRRGTDYDFVCAGFNKGPEAPVYRGTIPAHLFA